MLKFKNTSNLDPKESLQFFDTVDTTHYEVTRSSYIEVKENVIWKIENFLTSDECDQVVKTCETSLTVFDKNRCLIDTIKTRLKCDDFLEKLNNHCWKSPYGFSSNRIEWMKNDDTINEFLRICKYDNFTKSEWHRDDQFTQIKTIKSNYSIVIFLNDNYEGGSFTFRISKKDFVHCGYTVKEELDKMSDFVDVTVTPQKGMAVIFDQRLLHREELVVGTKYILRSDLICFGKNTEGELTKLECDLELLAKELFRYAQLLEKQNSDKCKELYEICTSLKQQPHLIEEYPEHLHDLMNIEEIKKEIIKGEYCSLRLLYRMGKRHKYKYSSPTDKFTMLKLASIYSALLSLQTVSGCDVDKEFIKILELMEFDTYMYSDINKATKYNITEEEYNQIVMKIEEKSSKYHKYVKLIDDWTNKTDIYGYNCYVDTYLDCYQIYDERLSDTVSECYDYSPSEESSDSDDELTQSDDEIRTDNIIKIEDKDLSMNSFMLVFNNVDYDKDNDLFTGSISFTSPLNSTSHIKREQNITQFKINFRMTTEFIKIECVS